MLTLGPCQAWKQPHSMEKTKECENPRFRMTRTALIGEWATFMLRYLLSWILSVAPIHPFGRPTFVAIPDAWPEMSGYVRNQEIFPSLKQEPMTRTLRR